MYTVPTGSDKRYKDLMRFLDRVQEHMSEHHLNTTEYTALSNLRLRINQMRFGTPAELEYPHWAEVYNRINEMLDQPRRVPIAGGAPSERKEHQEPDSISQLMDEELSDILGHADNQKDGTRFEEGPGDEDHVQNE